MVKENCREDILSCECFAVRKSKWWIFFAVGRFVAVFKLLRETESEKLHWCVLGDLKFVWYPDALSFHYWRYFDEKRKYTALALTHANTHACTLFKFCKRTVLSVSPQILNGHIALRITSQAAPRLPITALVVTSKSPPSMFSVKVTGLDITLLHVQKVYFSRTSE